MTAYAFPCGEKPRLFDNSKGPSDQDARRAQRICSACSFQLSCLRAGREGREYGIWGGETEPERFAALGLTQNDILLPECGTETAYRRHKAVGEECPENICDTAHRARARAYDKARRSRQAKERAERKRIKAEAEAAIEATRVSPFHAPLRPECGTVSGYRLHQKRSELRLTPHPDCSCREAHAKARAAERSAPGQEMKAAA
jgi:hypothetical protein